MKKNEKTSWGNVADWYDRLLEGDKDSYQVKVILPNLLRIADIKKDEKFLDMACGQGFFTRFLKGAGADTIGVDISPELIKIAKKKDKVGKYEVSNAEEMPMLENNFFEGVVCVLALQNIKDINKTFSEVGRILKDNGRFIFVLNHPVLRIPKMSFWRFDAETKIQYRELSGYLSEQRIAIQMNPGKGGDVETHSFHRPLQIFFKALAKNGFLVKRLEEWTSHKESDPGTRKEAEDMARKEFPLFMCIEAVKVSSK